jgi:HD-GYP domain-containing protein (c-di-GMP phosphodiesterase class II)
MTPPHLADTADREGAALGADAQTLLERLDQLHEENDALGRELLRCYEQLNLVFEITENIAKLQDPEHIQHSLLQRFGSVIGAGALFVDLGGECMVIEPRAGSEWLEHLRPEEIHTLLAKEIALVRTSQRAMVPNCDEAQRQALGGAHVLVVPLRQQDADPAVVIVLRPAGEPDFDSSDMLASESVLGYGGQVLSNVMMVRNLEQTAFETVLALANAIDAKDNYTCGHSERVGWLARQTGAALGLPEPDLKLLEWAGILHDVGKIGVAEEILNKPGKLTSEEFEEMKRHPHMSYEVLKPVARLGPVLSGVLHHHENWDGSGYPHGLSGEQIPLSARIIRIVDTFDALTSTRSYRRGFPVDCAVKILREEAGHGTDPTVTEVFIKLFERYAREQQDDFRQRFPHIPAGSGGACPAPDAAASAATANDSAAGGSQ